MSGVITTLLGADAGRPLFWRDGVWVSAGEVRDLAARVAVPAGDGPIFLHTNSAAHFLAGLLAAAAEDRVVALPGHAQPSYLSELGCASGALLDDAAFTAGDARRSLEAANPDPLLIFFTSGSTGAPKPVEKSLSRIDAEARMQNKLWDSQAAHVIATVSHQHIYGLLFRIAFPLLSGRTSDDAAATYWEDLEGRFGGATLISSPAHLMRLPPRNDLFKPPPGLIFSSGQLLPAPAAQACIEAFGAPATEILGSTETGGIAWRRQTEADAPWSAFPGVTISHDESGALTVQSPHLQEDAPLRTGDVIAPLADGRFRLLPRGDRIVKIDGKRVSLTRVEEALAALPEVAAAAALALPSRGEALAAIAELTPAGRQKLEADGAFRFSRALRAALAQTLEPAERPKHWRFPDRIPTNAQGKRVLADLVALFDADPLASLAPQFIARSENHAELTLRLSPELPYFLGHFPDQPILPGIAQVHIAAQLAERLWPDWRAGTHLSKLKFKRVLAPEQSITLHLARDGAYVKFRYTSVRGEVSEGELRAG